MNLNNFTIKAQEAVARAQQLAFDNSNPSIDTEHLLKALLNEEDSLVEFLLKKNNVNVNFVETKLDESITRLPKNSGGEPAQTISRDVNNVILRAGSDLKQFGDEFVSVEHLLLALVQAGVEGLELLLVGFLRVRLFLGEAAWRYFLRASSASSWRSLVRSQRGDWCHQSTSEDNWRQKPPASATYLDNPPSTHKKYRGHDEEEAERDAIRCVTRQLFSSIDDQRHDQRSHLV